MSTIAENRKTDETKGIEQVLRTSFPGAEAYRYNSASIRVRVINDVFAGKSKAEREKMVWPLMETLPSKTLMDVTMLLLLTPAEAADPSKLSNVEFDDPLESSL